MEAEKGHDYIRNTASFIRSHEHNISHVMKSRRPHEPSSLWNWFTSPTGNKSNSSLIYANDPYHLFYILIKIEALGINVGSLDVRIENLSGSMNNPYVPRTSQKDISDAMSISSLRSAISTASMFSLGGGWFRTRESQSVDSDLKYLYSVFTRLPALRMQPFKGRLLAELVNDPPSDSAIPMHSFKNLQILECHAIDPRILMGWDLLSQSLRSLTIKQCGVEDIPELLVNLVLEDKAIRENGGATRIIRPRLIHKPYSDTPSAEGPKTSPISESVATDGDPNASPGRNLPPYAWSSLTHLCLADNNLTFILFFPHLPSLFSLDLSSNLLVSIPPCLASLPRLKSLNISNNMIDSVLGVYSQIPSVESLNLSSNRLESLCGLERLERLSRIDLRDNQVQDPDEVGRLSVIAIIREIWVSGNPFTKILSTWRIRCFDLFAKEQREIYLDGYLPGLLEKNQMSYTISKDPQSAIRDDRPPSQPSSMRAQPVETLPPSVVVGGADARSNSNSIRSNSTTFLNEASPDSLQAKRRRKRFVDLGEQDKPQTTSPIPRRTKLHMRYSSEMCPGLENGDAFNSKDVESIAEDPISVASNSFQGQAARASTISRASGKRWNRVSASTYEGISDGEKLRKRIEELRNDVGDSWLKVLSQTQLAIGDTNKEPSSSHITSE